MLSVFKIYAGNIHSEINLWFNFNVLILLGEKFEC